MLTFTSAVGKLNLRVLWQHHTLVKSYKLVVEKLKIEYGPHQNWQKSSDFVHAELIIPPLTCMSYAVKQPHEICFSAQHQYYSDRKALVYGTKNTQL